MKTRIALAAALALSGSAALARDYDDRVSVSVSYADLDLSQAPGRAALERRVAGAVRRLCPGPSVLEPHALGDYRLCKRTAWSSARQQLAAIYERSRYAGPVPTELAASN